MTINYYSYEELKAAVIANASEENVNPFTRKWKRTNSS